MVDTEMSELELWAEFTEKMKEGIVSSFDQNVMSFEEDVRRLDSQRQMPGWNYCTFFILKEGLTNAFEMMNLHEEALRQYDELEASFFQILRGIISKSKAPIVRVHVDCYLDAMAQTLMDISY